MIDRTSINQVLGGLILQPKLLNETDKYSLTPLDFEDKFDRRVFKAIYMLYTSGAPKIRPIDIEGVFGQDPMSKSLFEQSNGLERVQDLIELAEVENFGFYYNQLKKFNLMTDLEKQGYSVKSFYEKDLTAPRASEINERFKELTPQDIIKGLKKQLVHLESEYAAGEEVEIESLADGIEELVESFGSTEEIGYPIQGAICNEIMNGALKGTLTIRSASSGLGKTRTAVMDACYLAYPIRYNTENGKWIQCGNTQKVLFIITEQQKKEIQKMVLAYLTDINEDRFRYANFDKTEQHIIKQALEIMKQYEKSFIVIRMPEPTIELINAVVRDQCIVNEVDVVFYDYIFISPSLVNEFKGTALRNDELLLFMTTALKNLAVELNVAVFTSTQVNAKADDNKDIRNESSLAGSRAIINKADNGLIMSRPTNDELLILKDNFISMYGTPNQVADVYKLRSGRWTQTRIWSYVDLGRLKKKDLFITNSLLEPLDDFVVNEIEVYNWDDSEANEIKELIERLNKID